ncbi:hypothetical protein CAG54_10975 [Vibrio sp. V27_P1S3P104]|nr:MULTISPECIES: hypothetical protein [unclassified Vibrio]NAX35502.1 hypothetical protein [Vibrio sp. V29_P1S30P107]NAX38020.1 hypothetical protein [Vibrio sp. V27_P1S3P104]
MSLYLVLKAFPNLSATQVMCLWVGVNITHWSEDSLNQVELVEPKLD